MLQHLKKSLVVLLVFSLFSLGLQSIGIAKSMVSDDFSALATVEQSMAMSDATADDCQEMGCCSLQSCESKLHCASVSALAFPVHAINFDRSDLGVVVSQTDIVVFTTSILSIYRPPWA
jgi:hypothetical protein